jgi:phasin
MMDFQELVDEAFSDLLKKHGRPTDLKTALRDPTNYKTSRETVEKADTQVKNTCEKAKVAAEQATDLLRDTYATAAKGATDYNLKIIEFALANTDSTFDYAQELMEAKHPAELVVVSIAHTRKWFATMIAQTKELTELA